MAPTATRTSTMTGSLRTPMSNRPELQSEPYDTDRVVPDFVSDGTVYYDGRKRSSVPPTIRAMGAGDEGSFSIMYIPTIATEPPDMDAAARRVSESTFAASERYNKIGYRPLRRQAWPRQNERIPAPPVTVPKPLSPADTKAEQARLLTLLRSLNPVSVSDQICKALAFFGGVPEAPPPGDGVFPESASGFGPGSLFVGWLSEIFPKVDVPVKRRRKATPTSAATQRLADSPPTATEPLHTAEATTAAAAAAAAIQPTTGEVTQPVVAEKRRRGRPKGSKSTKVRKDKGTKRASKKASGDAAAAGPSGFGEAGGSDSAHPPVSAAVETGSQLSTTTAPVVQGEDQSTSGSKTRGRRKGTKNRPKTSEAGDQSANPSANSSHPVNSAIAGGHVGGTAIATALQGGTTPQKRRHDQSTQSAVPMTRVIASPVASRTPASKRQRTTNMAGAGSLVASGTKPAVTGTMPRARIDGASSQLASASSSFDSLQSSGLMPGRNTSSASRQNYVWHTVHSTDPGLAIFRPPAGTTGTQKFHVMGGLQSLQSPSRDQGASGQP